LKCLRPTYVGDFGLKGRELRLKGQNRIGNLIVENRNYCEFEDWLNVSQFLLVERVVRARGRAGGGGRGLPDGRTLLQYPSA